MNTPEINGIVVVPEDLLPIREQIEDLCYKLNSHVGQGADAHLCGNLTRSGFMSPDLYSLLLSYRDQIDALKDSVGAGQLPIGAILYWNGEESEVPSEFALCDGSNGTLDVRNYYMYGTATDSEYGTTAGSNTISTGVINNPRHTHTFKNYFWCEEYDELNARKTSDMAIDKYESIYGSRVETERTCYPRYFSYTTESTGSGSTSSSTTVNVEPPYNTLRAIQKIKDATVTFSVSPAVLSMLGSVQETEYIPASDAIGTLSITAGEAPAEGCVALDGSWLYSEMYPDLFRYVNSSGLLKDEVSYMNIYNKTGYVPFFAVNSDASQIRLPVIPGNLAMRTYYPEAGTDADSEDEYPPDETVEDAESVMEVLAAADIDIDDSNIELGFSKDRDGLQEVFFSVNANSANTLYIPFTKAFTDIPFFVKVTNRNMESDPAMLTDITAEGCTVSCGNHNTDDILEVTAFGV